MSRKRHDIRHKIVDLLRRQKTAVGDRVYGNRSITNWDQDLPVINIYPRGESVEEWSSAPRINKRTIQLVVEIIDATSSEDETSDSLDLIAEDVERILSADDTLASTVEDIFLNGVEFQYDEGGERPIGSARLIYSAVYLQEAPPNRWDQDHIRDLNTIDARWNIGTASDPDPEARDTIDLT